MDYAKLCPQAGQLNRFSFQRNKLMLQQKLFLSYQQHLTHTNNFTRKKARWCTMSSSEHLEIGFVFKVIMQLCNVHGSGVVYIR